MDRLEAHRHFFADLVTTTAGAAKNERLKDAFASIPRERFVGAGPWEVFAGGNYVETPTDDPAFLYQDVVVALAPERRINNGQPVLHAINLEALNVKQGETVVHIGAGTGYYTAVLARLTGATGTVVAYQIEHDLAQSAARFVCPTMFVSCVGARDEATAQKLSVAFKRGDFRNVRSLRRNSPPDDTCWCAGDGWWLSNA